MTTPDEDADEAIEREEFAKAMGELVAQKSEVISIVCAVCGVTASAETMGVSVPSLGTLSWVWLRLPRDWTVLLPVLNLAPHARCPRHGIGQSRRRRGG